MKKVIVSMNVTLDGRMAGPDGELDWHSRCWSPDMADALGEQLGRADTILLGRVTYLAMAGFWPAKAADLSFPREDLHFADMMNTHRKAVFSNTLSRAAWNNSVVVRGEIRTAIGNLKNKQGKDIIVYGSGQLVSALMQLALVDELRLWLHPVILGQGKLFFRPGGDTGVQRLLHTSRFSSGVVLLSYAMEGDPARADKPFPVAAATGNGVQVECRTFNEK